MPPICKNTIWHKQNGIILWRYLHLLLKAWSLSLFTAIIWMKASRTFFNFSFCGVKKKRRSNGIRATPGWVNKAWILICGWTIPSREPILLLSDIKNVNKSVNMKEQKAHVSAEDEFSSFIDLVIYPKFPCTGLQHGPLQTRSGRWINNHDTLCAMWKVSAGAGTLHSS